MSDGGVAQRPDHFPAPSVIRRVSSEPALLMGGGRALLLQLADPVVAQGVADHSDFKRNPFKRLQGTLEATYAVVFGSVDLAAGVGARIAWIHSFVVGPGYQANDPEHLLWVHATLVDTALWCYSHLVGPLGPADQETYYEQMTRVAAVFGVPLDDQPRTLAHFHQYFDATVTSLEMTDVGRDLARFILQPTLPGRLHVPLRPPLRLERLLTLGATPEPIRGQLGVTWDAEHQQRFERAVRRIRRAAAATPRSVRTAPIAAWGRILLAQAERHVGAFRAEHPVQTAVGTGDDLAP